MMKKNVIFISHVKEEANLARILKSYLEDAFLDMVDIFVSSDSKSIAAGDPWLDKIEDALRNASLALILCSQKSISRPWINFEAGAIWIRNMPILPLCHTDLRPGALPAPLSTLQSVEINQASGLKQVIQKIAEGLGCKPPSIDFNEIVEKIRVCEEGYRRLLNDKVCEKKELLTELESLKHVAMAALRRDPEDIYLFEQKLHEIDLLENISGRVRLEAINDIGLEVTLNSEQGTSLLLQHLLWQISPSEWSSISFAEENIGDLENGRYLLETISSILWTWGVQAIEYGRSKEVFKEIMKGIFEVRDKGILIGADRAQQQCNRALHSFLKKANEEKRHDIFQILTSSMNASMFEKGSHAEFYESKPYPGYVVQIDLKGPENDLNRISRKLEERSPHLTLAHISYNPETNPKEMVLLFDRKEGIYNSVLKEFIGKLVLEFPHLSISVEEEGVPS